MPQCWCRGRKRQCRSGNCTLRAWHAQGASGCVCKFHEKSECYEEYSVLREEEEELEDEKEESAEGEYFNDGEDVEFDLEEDGEDEPFSAELLLTTLLELARLQFEHYAVDQHRVADHCQQSWREIVKRHIIYKTTNDGPISFIFLTSMLYFPQILSMIYSRLFFNLAGCAARVMLIRLSSMVII